MTKKIEQIISLCMIHDIEIVSYGLAPNPNGFCYEIGNTPADAAEKLDELLDSLTAKEKEELIAYHFGNYAPRLGKV